MATDENKPAALKMTITVNHRLDKVVLNLSQGTSNHFHYEGSVSKIDSLISSIKKALEPEIRVEKEL